MSRERLDSESMMKISNLMKEADVPQLVQLIKELAENIREKTGGEQIDSEY